MCTRSEHHARGSGAHLLAKLDHEAVVAFRQHEAEAVFLALGQPRRQPVGLIVEMADGFFNPRARFAAAPPRARSAPGQPLQH